MPNILQVTEPGVSKTQQIKNDLNIKSPNVILPQGPDAVTGVAGKENGAQNGASGGGVDFASNYQNFLTKLGESAEISKQLANLLFGADTQLQASEITPQFAELMDTLYSELTMNSADEIAKYIDDQQKKQVMFKGGFFDAIRKMMKDDMSPVMRSNILRFIQQYSSMAEGPHHLTQMKNLGEDIRNLMLPSVRGDLEDVLEQMDWDAPAGDTKKNTEILNNQVIPFLSKYISRTHNYGPIRTASVLFSLYAVKYENGDSDDLDALFKRLMRYGDFGLFFEDEPEAEYAKLKEELQKQQGQPISKLIADVLERGARGEGGADSADRAQQVMKHLLMNQSVYMPLLHMLVPFRYQDKNVVSEMWIDPDAHRDKNSDGSGKKIFVKFTIQKVGSFELVAYMEKGALDMQLFVPGTLEEQYSNVNRQVSEIVKRNGLRINSLQVAEKVRDLRVDQVFPEIREKERGINVTV
ncbi:MAG: hypothetical protein K5760_04600 [Clostridium sp.]|nr:hypothetical protein [Clostridium sp.]